MCTGFGELPIENKIMKAMNKFLQKAKSDEAQLDEIKLDENEKMLDKALNLLNKYVSSENVTEEQKILALELIQKMTELEQQMNKIVSAFFGN